MLSDRKRKIIEIFWALLLSLIITAFLAIGIALLIAFYQYLGEYGWVLLAGFTFLLMWLLIFGMIRSI